MKRLWNWLKSLFTAEEKERENSDEVKRLMCKRAIYGGVCPHVCDICAWNTLK